MHPARIALLIVASACVTLASACSGLSSADLVGLPGGGFGGGAAQGAGGSSTDTNIDIGAKDSGAGSSEGTLPKLCGAGCEPGGDPSECAPGGDPGAGGGGGSAQVRFCRLALSDGVSVPQCLPAGTFEAGGPCQTGADCAGGLGCASTDAQGGVCRQYCCGPAEACAPGTYCDARPMAESAAVSDEPALIPVCVPATNCRLLDDSSCVAGLTCTIVRDDGTTSCLSPGTGRVHDDCPCAPGFVCSRLTNECKKLCHLSSGVEDCGASAKCQGGSMSYPPGFGVCVGGDY